MLPETKCPHLSVLKEYTKFNRKNNDKSRVEMQQFIAKLLVLKMGAKRSISLLLYIPLDKIS